jgi:GTP cyclohydrolase I
VNPDDQKKLLVTLLKDIFPDEYWDDSVEDTARRVLAYWKDMDGHVDLASPTVFSPEYGRDNMVVAKDLDFASLCAHHLLPFYGKAHVGYIPHSNVIGLSKIPRIVDYFAKRPQIQERMTSQIAHYIKKATDAKGVIVVVEATHTCMACRGVMKHDGRMVTSVPLGLFLTSSMTKQEFFDTLKRSSL